MKKVAIVILMLLVVCQSSIIRNLLDNTTFNVHTPRLLHNSKKSWTPFTTVILPGGSTVKEMSSCTSLNSSLPLKGLAVVVLPQGGCPQEIHAEVGKKAGASAVFVVAGNTPSFLACFKAYDRKYNESVPIMTISTSDFIKISKELQKNAKVTPFRPVVVTVIQDENEWIKMTGGGGMIFFQVFVLSVMFVTLVFGVRGQVLFLMEQGLKLTAAQVCLFFCNLSLICNIIAAFDPFSIRRWYVYPLFVTTSFFGMIFCNISSMSLAYFFQEMLLTKKMAYPGLSHFKIPFIITSVALIAIYISFCVILLQYRGTIPLTRATFLIPSGILFFLLAFFLVGGFQIITSMKRFRKKTIGRVTITVFFSVFGMTSLAILHLIIGILTPMNEKGYLGYIILFILCQLMIIVPQVFVFKHPSFSMLKRSKSLGENSTGNPMKLREDFSEKEFKKSLSDKGSK